jgi:bacillithiol synthase
VSRPPLVPLSGSLADYPGFSRFALDWLSGVPKATALLPRNSPRYGTAAAADHAEVAAALVAANRAWGIDAEADLGRWQRGESAAIIAGQQVGFAGGPLYTFAKIASLIKMKQRNEGAGIPTTLFFWLATEDHDFDEVATVTISRPSEIIELRARSSDGRGVVGPQPVPEQLIADFVRAVGIERPSWLPPGVTFADSFARLLREVFGSSVVLVDAMTPAVRRAGRGLFRTLIDRWGEVQQQLDQRARKISAAGYAPQVTTRQGEGYTLLYVIEPGGERAAIHKRGGQWQVGGKPIDRAALDARIEEHPETISTAALTRPLLQDLVFAPAVFVGGPAEVSYYAQIETLHEMLGIDAPQAALRGHTLVAPKRALRAMQSYGIPPARLFQSADLLVAERESSAVEEIAASAARGREALAREIERIREIAFPADHSLARSVRRSIGHLEYHFGKLVERATKAVARHDRERYEAIRALVATLAPRGVPQDRIVAWYPYWRDAGSDMLTSVIDAIEPDTPTFNIVGI